MNLFQLRSDRVGIFGLALCLSLSLSAPLQAESGAVVGKVVKLKGQAWKTRESVAHDKTELKAGTPLLEGDILVTSEKSELVVILGSKTAALMIKPASTVKITQDAKSNWIIDLRLGGLVSQISAAKMKPRHFQVKTSTATMGVRGTTFFVKVEPGKDLFLCTCIGSVTIDDKVTLTSKHHDVPKFIRPGSETLESRMSASDMGHDHSDEDALALMKLIE